VCGELEEERMYVNHDHQRNYISDAKPTITLADSTPDRPTPAFALQLPFPDAEKSPIPNKIVETATPSEIGKLSIYSP
jgi:hypothetical protein